MSRRELSFLKKIYAVIGIIFIIYSSYLVVKLVMHIWHKEGKREEAKIDEGDLFKMMMSEEKKVTYDLGYKVIKEEELERHFHHVGEGVVHDEINLCIRCHGDIPHDKNKSIRAFLNMHSDFLACETCHIRLKDSKRFVWYNKVNGDQVNKLAISKYLSNPTMKLIPLVKIEGNYVRPDTDELKAFVERFREAVIQLPPAKKSQGLKIIHKMVDKRPVQCDECHAPTLDDSYLPLLDVGYKKERVLQILSNEVVGMVNKYKKFYIPKFLEPGNNE
ncbi:cytochrome C [Deferribacter autotrophicus]|uniref:Cytochrome C n=1 Tax=Deferribacter autotrophicus TaxID=500465 RepID=A0A5A8F679_9BACT|nr:cytochrome C [Deferribacter autotrophicus]KAA0258913.1 cytochrome C [Deferribacter autotrophicus]